MPRLNFSLTEEELGGYTLNDIGCGHCNDMCSYKTARMYEGRPIIICGNKPEGIEVLKRSKARREQGS